MAILEKFEPNPKGHLRVTPDEAVRPSDDAIVQEFGEDAPPDGAAKSNGHDDNALNIEIARLAKLRPADYEHQRKSAAKKFHLRTAILDNLVAAVRAAHESVPGQGRKLELPEPQLWPEQLDGAALISELEAAIGRYVVLPAADALTCALWILHAYCFDAFTWTPRLAITSPEKRCGKTTLLRLVGELVPRALRTENITAAALFRTVELACPILLIDEADTFLPGNEELRGILNSGYLAGGQVTRTVGDDNEPRLFSTHCPAAVAQIGKLPGTLADRSVMIAMRRSRPGEKGARFRLGKTPELSELARKAAWFVADNRAAIAGCEPFLPDGTPDRVADNWESLLAVAETAGGGVADRARRVMLEARGVEADADQSLGTLLLSDIREAFETSDKAEFPSKALIDALIGMGDRPWGEINHGKPITQNWLARRLKEYRIRPGNVGPKKERAKGYLADEFKDAFSCYLPNPPFQSVHPPLHNEINELDGN